MHWPHLTKDDHERLFERLGNHALLTPTENKGRGNGSFEDAKQIYAKSNFRFTRELASHKGDWDEGAIEKRQTKMAEMAVDIWPSRPPEAPKKKK